MRIVISGASGFIGRALCRQLRGDYEVVSLSRSAEQTAKTLVGSAQTATWDGRTLGDWVNEIDGAAAVVNLAGENVASDRWTSLKKERILQSRTDCTRALVEAIKRVNNRPAVMIQASAVGYYGTRGMKAPPPAAQHARRNLPGAPGFGTLRAGSFQALETFGAMTSNDWN